MKAEDLVRQLTSDLKPIKVIRPARMALLVGGACLAFATACAFWVLHARPDLAAKSLDPLFIFNLLASFLIIFLGLVLAVRMGLPGRSRSSWVMLIAFAPALAILIVNLVSGFSGAPQEIFHTWTEGADFVGKSCTIGALSVAALAFPLIGWQLRKGAPRSPALSGAIAGLAAFGTGLVTMTLHCGFDNAAHVIIYHLVLPLALAAAAGLAVGRRFFKW